jgi:hypothetical protein
MFSKREIEMTKGLLEQKMQHVISGACTSTKPSLIAHIRNSLSWSRGRRRGGGGQVVHDPRQLDLSLGSLIIILFFMEKTFIGLIFVLTIHGRLPSSL